MSIKLIKAFQITVEEYADAFERFANAFLVDDDPELKALGGKKDKGMDAYVYDDESGKAVKVVQSCVSPAGRARTKILDTIRRLKENDLVPEVFIYCTSSSIGTELDETKRELRRDYKVALEICDAPWFVARLHTTRNRAIICEAYAHQVLEPFVASLQPDKLYNLVLNERQQRIAVQYLEATHLDRAHGSNLTKGIFDALIACVTRDSDPPSIVYTENAIVTAICAMFPSSHAPRIAQIVPGRIKNLVNKRALHFNQQAGGYVLSFERREKIQKGIDEARDRELSFLATLSAAVKETVKQREIDYTFSVEEMVHIGHQVVLWYLREQGKEVSDPTAGLLNVLNAEKLLDEFLSRHPLSALLPQSKLTVEYLKDVLPHALYLTLSSVDKEVQRFLRGKADLFIVHGFLQATPDVQEACRKLLGGDVLYLDTSILIRCLAEHYSTGARKPLLDTLAAARALGYQLRTWRPYIGELVSHLRNRVYQEWFNHYRNRGLEELRALLRTARTLVRVFCERAMVDRRSLGDIVVEILGSNNEQENAVEFLKEEFGIVTEDMPSIGAEDEGIRSRAFDEWSRMKRRPENIAQDRFEILVRNDVNSYVSILKLRREQRADGPNYGHKIWYLSLDRMPCRIARVMSEDRNSSFEVAVSFSYLMNCVATLAMSERSRVPDDLIPATTILEESEMVPSEIRAVYEKEFSVSEKPFLQVRRIRDLTHRLKSGVPLSDEPLDTDVDFIEYLDEET